MSGFIFSRDAEDDLDGIWTYLADESSIAIADKMIEEVYSAIEGLVRMPHKGHTKEDLTDKNVFFWRVRSLYIVYDPKTSPLQIARILHVARDIKNVL
jgi:plasmid stabilization system protein ParE